MIKTRLEVSPNLTSTLVFLRNLSFYDEKERKRKIKKNEASIRKIASQTTRSKNSVNKDMQELKKQEIVLEESSWYYIKDIPEGQSYIELPHSFVTQLNSTFHQDYIKIYCWLYRELMQYNNSLFSCKRLIEQALGLTYNKDRVKKVNEILYQLALNGLIVIADVKVKTTVNGKATFMWKLLEIRTEFKVINMVNDIVNKQLKGADDFIGDELLLDECNYEVGMTIGFTNEGLKHLEDNISKPCYYLSDNMYAEGCEFLPIEDIAKKYNATIDETVKVLKQYSRNKQYFDYLSKE